MHGEREVGEGVFETCSCFYLEPEGAGCTISMAIVLGAWEATDNVLSYESQRIAMEDPR
jgi:hypothetical protein